MTQNDEAIDAIGQLDHERANEYLVFGPPGTGKSTHLTRQIQRAAARFGDEAVLCTSFSRAAAAELVSRDLPIPKNAVGTLHAHCYRALGNPDIAEANVDEWNREQPNLAISGQRAGGRMEGEESKLDDDSETEKMGDLLLGELCRYRARRTPRAAWPVRLLEFEKRWRAYKDEYDLFDFTDLIETCLRDVRIAPGRPSVIFADESQDFTRLEFDLVRRWGQNAEYFVCAGDDDQTIFSFSGASPDAMLDNDLPESHKIVLKQSYRVPRAVQAAAEKVIKTVGRRQTKEYRPRDEEGSVGRLFEGTWRNPDALLIDAEKHLAEGRTVMFLASCAYMLHPLCRALRAAGIPFANRYRISNGNWNPLRRDARGSAANRVMSLLAAHPGADSGKVAWNIGEIALWSEWMEAKGALKRGAKKRLTDSDHGRVAYMEDLIEIFEEKALDELIGAMEGSVDALLGWWRSRLSVSCRPRAEFALAMAARGGIEALCAEPMVTVGTIHSVKGGQADVVYLIPDLSRSGWSEYERRGESRDSVTRLVYVGMTRARERLVWCPQVSPMAVTQQ